MEQAGEETICGIATPLGEGGVGIVRISGPDSISVADQIVRLRSKQSLQNVLSHTLHFGDIVRPQPGGAVSQARMASTAGTEEIVDEGLVVVMRGPKSFTAEDVVEIQVHGGAMVLQLVCDACVAAGARLALPGEFTKRAFLNGRLDLSQAEAVLDTIRAKSEAGLRMAQRHLRGELGVEVRELRSRLLGLLSEVEAGIDFAEEDLTFVDSRELLDSLGATALKIERMLDGASRGIKLRDGARVVIAGRPNVGKSSLMNGLLGEDRAIVTNIPGTTRDVIEESVVWGGVSVTLVDTAGLRETDDVVEREGIKRTRSAVEEADLVVEVVDASGYLAGGMDSSMRGRGQYAHLVVLNKIDLVSEADVARLSGSIMAGTTSNVVSTSVRSGVGLDRLRELIMAHMSRGSFEPDGGAVVTNLRHRDALERARIALNRSIEAVQIGVDPECVAVDVRESADALGEVIGAITSDEILNRIFSQFCIGK